MRFQVSIVNSIQQLEYRRFVFDCESNSVIMAQIEVIAKHLKDSKTFPFPTSSSVAELKEHLANLWHLAPSVKLIGLSKGKPPGDTEQLAKLDTVQGKQILKLMVVGNPRAEIKQIQEADTRFEVQRVADELAEQERRRDEGTYGEDAPMPMIESSSPILSTNENTNTAQFQLCCPPLDGFTMSVFRRDSTADCRSRAPRT